MSQVYQDWLEAIALDKEIRGKDLRVLMLLLSTAEGSSTEISQAEISKKLGMKSSNVSRAISNLCSRGVIEKKRQGGKIIGYRLVPELRSL